MKGFNEQRYIQVYIIFFIPRRTLSTLGHLNDARRRGCRIFYLHLFLDFFLFVLERN